MSTIAKVTLATLGAAAVAAAVDDDDDDDSDDLKLRAIVNPNLITDGTFDTTDAWTGAASGYSPTNGANTVTIETANTAEPWSVNMQQVVDMEAGADYTLTFDVSGRAGRTPNAGIGENGDDFANHKK